MEPLVAVACAADPDDPGAFSGIPRSVVLALRDAGVDAVPIAASLPPRTQRLTQIALAATLLRPSQLRGDGALTARLRAAVRANQTRLLASPFLEATRSRLAARAVARHPTGVTGAVQYGTDFRLPGNVPVVTYDDQTIRQAMESYAYPWITRMTARELERMLERQRMIFGAAVACCATTHWAAESIVRDCGVPADRVHVVGVGANNTTDPPLKRDWSVPRYLFVGKDWTRKNGAAVVDAFAVIRDRHADATLDVVGGHPPLAALGVTGHGQLEPGAPDEMARLGALYARSTCLVLPSLHEPSGVAFVEAASAGVGAIGSASGGSNTLIGDGGLVVAPRDVRAIIDAMEHFSDPQSARGFGGRAARRSSLFTWDQVARRLLRALEAGDTGADFL